MSRRFVRWLMPVVLALALTFVVVGCGGGGSSSSSSPTTSEEPAANEEETGGAEEEASGGSLAAAEEQVEDAYTARFTKPPSKPNPAAKGKEIWFISPGQASANAAAFYTAVQEAMPIIGWKVKLFDSKLDPSKYSEGIREAVAAGADGIIAESIDCSEAKSAYEVAQKAEIPVVTIIGLDCDETESGGPELFSEISLGSRYESWPAAYEAWGSDLAAWSITAAEGKANAINMTNEQFQIIKDLGEGYGARIEECEECSLTNVPWTVAEAGGKLAATVQAAILKEPEANALQDSANPELGMSQGVLQAGKTSQIKVVGGLGLPEDFALLKEESKGLNALAAWPLKWWGWAAVDTLNSLFNGEEPEDSGLGWQMIDLENNLPTGETFEPSVDFESAYKTRWGK